MKFAPPTQIKRARRLRHQSTDVEKRLWNRLRAHQLGVKFRRQHPVGGYILDFACEQEKLAIELDGGQHNEEPNRKRDAVRTAILERSGWCILRFWNNDVIENMNGVLTVIAEALTRNPLADSCASGESE